MKPLLTPIISSLPHSPLSAAEVTAHVNEACGVPKDTPPTEKTSYSWSHIYTELRSQGWTSHTGLFIPPRG